MCANSSKPAVSMIWWIGNFTGDLQAVSKREEEDVCVCFFFFPFLFVLGEGEGEGVCCLSH